MPLWVRPLLLLIVVDHLRRRLSQLKLVAHLLQTRSELFNLFLQVLHFTVFFEELVQNLPNEFQSGISAGFELVARKP
jgi:hypothetical protein